VPKAKQQQIQATIVSVKPSLESQPYVTVTFRLSNGGSTAQSVSGYDVSWPGGAQHVDGLALRVDPATDVLRTVRVGPAAGDLDSLTADAARISVH